jgi:hypothetical protein
MDTQATYETTGRVPLDFYETPGWQTWALMNHVHITGRCYEPCVGGGAIPLAMASRGDGVHRYWITNDIDTRWRADSHHDAREEAAWHAASPDWVVSNFPFNVATDIVKRAHAAAHVGVAVLLRLSWLEPTADRRDFLAEFPPDLLIVLPRTRYNPNSKSVDSVTTAWMVWYTNWETNPEESGKRAARGVIVHPTKGYGR